MSAIHWRCRRCDKAGFVGLPLRIEKVADAIASHHGATVPECEAGADELVVGGEVIPPFGDQAGAAR